MDEKKLQELYALRETYKTYSYKINIFFSLTLDFRLGFVQPRTTYNIYYLFSPLPSNPSNSRIQLSHELRNEAVNISPPFVR